MKAVLTEKYQYSVLKVCFSHMLDLNRREYMMDEIAIPHQTKKLRNLVFQNLKLYKEKRKVKKERWD